MEAEIALSADDAAVNQRDDAAAERIARHRARERDAVRGELDEDVLTPSGEVDDTAGSAGATGALDDV